VKTINYAISQANQKARFSATAIKLADGVYPEDIAISRGSFFIEGNQSSPSSVRITGFERYVVLDVTAECYIRGVEIRKTNITDANVGIVATYGGKLRTQDLIINMSAIPDTSHKDAAIIHYGGQFWFYALKLIGSCRYAFTISHNGGVSGLDLTAQGPAAYTAFANVSHNGRFALANATVVTGALSGARYIIQSNGDIAGVENLPVSGLTNEWVDTGARAN
jgi:hypothetical protein